MKKINLFLILCLLFTLTACTSNNKKEIGSLENFETSANKNGFTTQNNMYSYENLDYITNAMIAMKDDTTIEMVIYDTEENATKVQNKQIEAFKTLKSINSNIKKEKGQNYYKFVMISNNYYMVTSRIDNTLIFTKSKLEVKSDIENILNDMNY